MMMNLKRKSVLIIGWEYPPKMVGGLAIATYGIVKALSTHINVKLIIPYKDKDTPMLDNVEVYGLNTIQEDFPEIQIEINETEHAQIKTDIHYLQNISVYPSMVITSSDVSTTSDSYNTVEVSEEVVTRKNYLTLFQSEEVYGYGLWDKMLAFEKAVSKVAEKISFDMIHSHDWLTFNAGMAVKKVSKKPLAVHVHALETDRVGINVQNEIYAIEKSAMEFADIVFPVSNYTKKCIIDHYKIPKEKIIPIHNAIEVEAIGRWNHLIPQKIVTFLGRITLQKGPEYLFETIQKVTKTYKNVRFVIAGSGDKLSDLLMDGAYEQLSKYMIFTGFISRCQVNSLLATTDVYFMPSVSEPFGLTALEAASAGVACVITKQSGVAEVLTSALQADFWDTDKFANQIITLLKDDEQRKKIATQQQEEISSVNWNVSAEKIVTEYSKIPI